MVLISLTRAARRLETTSGRSWSCKNGLEYICHTIAKWPKLTFLCDLLLAFTSVMVDVCLLLNFVYLFQS